MSDNFNEQEAAQELERMESGGSSFNSSQAEDMSGSISNQGLGSVNMSNFNGRQKAESADVHLGWVSFNPQNLPSQGRFYPKDVNIKIRSAKVNEIRNFSTIDENDILSIDENLNSVLESCIMVSSQNSRMSYKDICEEDRFILIFAIRDLTFPEPENTLKVDWTDKKGKKHEIDLKREYFDYFKIPEELDKYYDETERAYIIKTRNYGDIMMRPPSIGVMQEITKYIKDRRDKELNIDQSLIQIAPFVATDWRVFNQKRLFELEIEMNGWDNKKYLLLYNLAEKMKVGIQPEIKVMIEDEEASIPINFQGGIKSLFVVQDISGELL